MQYNTIGPILQGEESTEENARDFALGFVWCEAEVIKQTIGHARYVDTVNGIEIYYDYAADYYFFCTDEE